MYNIFGRKVVKSRLIVNIILIGVLILIIIVFISIDKPSNHINDKLIVVYPDTLVSKQFSSDKILVHNEKLFLF